MDPNGEGCRNIDSGIDSLKKEIKRQIDNLASNPDKLPYCAPRFSSPGGPPHASVSGREQILAKYRQDLHKALIITLTVVAARHHLRLLLRAQRNARTKLLPSLWLALLHTLYIDVSECCHRLHLRYGGPSQQTQLHHDFKDSLSIGKLG